MAHEHDKPAHPYHLVEASIWPLLSSLAAGLLAFGAVSYMHDWAYGALKLKVGFLGVAVCMFFWWRDVIRESFQGFHTKVVQIGLRYGVVLFIASEVMFFVAFFWAYFDSALFPDGGVWPPEGIKTFNPFELPLLNTLILLLSGCTVTWAHHALLHKDQKGLVQGLAASVALGVVFLALQMFEYSHAAFGLKDGIYAATFYLATGFHGFHVFVGTVFLFVCWRRAVRGHFTPENHVGFESAAWYWHFVDVVWLFLFLGIYVYGA